MYSNSTSSVIAWFNKSSTIILVLVSSLIATPGGLAKVYHSKFISNIKLINIGGPLTGPKGDYSVSVHACIWPWNRQLFSWSCINFHLMVPHWAIKQQIKPPISKLIHACVITAWNWGYHDQHHLVELNIVHTEPPFKINYIVNGFLVWLWSEQSFWHPPTIGYLVWVLRLH